MVGDATATFEPKEAAMAQNNTSNLDQHLAEMYRGLVCINWANAQGTKLGTAKYKALEQMQSYAQTLDKKNPIAARIDTQVKSMSRSVSKQIMTDKSSETILPQEKAQKTKEFGEKLFNENKKALDELIARGQKGVNFGHKKEKQKLPQHKSKQPKMDAKTAKSNNGFAPKPTEFDNKMAGKKQETLDEFISHRQKTANFSKAREKMHLLMKASEKQDMSVKQKAPQYRALDTNVAAKTPESLTPHKLKQNEIMQMLWKQKKQNIE